MFNANDSSETGPLRTELYVVVLSTVRLARTECRSILWIRKEDFAIHMVWVISPFSVRIIRWTRKHSTSPHLASSMRRAASEFAVNLRPEISCGMSNAEISCAAPSDTPLAPAIARSRDCLTETTGFRNAHSLTSFAFRNTIQRLLRLFELSGNGTWNSKRKRSGALYAVVKGISVEKR